MGENLKTNTLNAGLASAADRADLQARLNYFRAHHQHRLQDAKSNLPTTAATILTALPALLHLNHPSLPGYHSSRSPRGIKGHKFNADERRALKQLAPGYQFSAAVQKLHIQQDIHALFFMGSAGSVAHTKHSDLDIWVCLPAELHQAMVQKLNAIAQWARHQGVELQCFAVDPAQFTGGTDLAKSPLLLDEFYRTACLISGCYPLWWLVPSDAEYLYPQIGARCAQFVPAASTIDFGAITTFEPMELFAAGVRELERSLRTPYKSLMKLALLESYALGAKPLSSLYKDLVTSGTSSEALDVYLLLARHLDSFFKQQGALDLRREFLHRAWLIKTGRGNARLSKHPAWWNLAQQWGYTERQLEHLRWPNQWPLTEVIAEHHRVVAAFAHALSFLSGLEVQLAGQAQTTNFAYLKSRLANTRALVLEHTQYNDKLLHAIVPKTHRGEATIQKNTDGAWQLLEDDYCIITRPTLVQIFLWLKRQGLGMPSLSPQLANVERYRQISTALLQEPVVALLNAQSNSEAATVATVTEEDDPLSYSEQQDCLIEHIDLVHTPRSGRSQALFFNDAGAAIAAILERPKVVVVAIGDVLRQRITSRVQQLVEEARCWLIVPQRNYLFQLGARICCLHQAQARGIEVTYFRDPGDFFAHGPIGQTLISGQGRLAQLNCGKELAALLRQPSLIVPTNKQRLTVIYRDNLSLAQLHPPPRTQANFTQSLSLFIAIAKRRGLEVPRLFELDPDAALTSVVNDNVDDHLRFRLVFRYANQGWSVQCGLEHWHHRKLDLQLINAVKKQILAFRNSAVDYPIYLTDLEYAGKSFISSLRMKYDVEDALNAPTVAKAAAALNRLNAANS